MRKRGEALLALLLLLLGAARGEAQLVPYFEGQNRTTINVCTSQVEPMVWCDGLPPTEYSGYEISLFAKVRARLDWSDQMLNWSCLDWDAMIDHLEAADGVCDIAVAGVNVMSPYLDRGIIFSWPTFRNGLSILTVPTSTSVDYWAFLDAFSWELWVAMVLTPIAVAICLFAIERWAPDARPGGGGAFTEIAHQDFQSITWAAVGRPMQTTDFVARSVAGNMLIVVYAFMVLIIVSLYTAETAANVTTERLTSSIESLADLQGKAVGTWSKYVDDLQMRGIAAAGYPWNNQADEAVLMEQLKSGMLRALVLDTSFVEYIAAPDCDLMVVGQQFNLFDQAVAFPRDFNNTELLEAYNEILVSLRESGDVEALINSYISRTPAPCKLDNVQDAATGLTFKQVAGLWIMLSGAIVVAAFIVCAQHFLLWNARRVARQHWYITGRQRFTKGVQALSTLPHRTLSGQKNSAAEPGTLVASKGLRGGGTPGPSMCQGALEVVLQNGGVMADVAARPAAVATSGDGSQGQEEQPAGSLGGGREQEGEERWLAALREVQQEQQRLASRVGELLQERP